MERGRYQTYGFVNESESKAEVPMIANEIDHKYCLSHLGGSRDQTVICKHARMDKKI